MSISITKISSSRTVSRGQSSTMATTSTSKPYPQHPDVIMKKLPFYVQQDILLKPSSLQPTSTKGKYFEQSYSFYLTPSQSKLISNSKKMVNSRIEYRQQVQLRFSLSEISCEQTDAFPKSLIVKVNGKVQPLPNPLPAPAGTEPRRPPGPLNITNLCKLVSTQPNTVSVQWAADPKDPKAYTMSVYQVENLTHQDLLDQLRAKGVRKPDYTKALIKEKLSDGDQEIATTSCKVSLACPLVKMRMKIPARASTCDHLQCFDAQFYLMMNEKKPKWECPVCNKSAEPDRLQIDGFFLDLVQSSRLPADEHEIVLHQDGSWDPLVAGRGQDQQQGRARARTRPGPASVTRSPVPASVSLSKVREAGVKRPLADTQTITLEETVSPRSNKRSKVTSEVEIECIDID